MNYVIRHLLNYNKMKNTLKFLWLGFIISFFFASLYPFDFGNEDEEEVVYVHPYFYGEEHEEEIVYGGASFYGEDGQAIGQFTFEPFEGSRRKIKVSDTTCR